MHVGGQEALISKRDMLLRILPVLSAADEQLTFQLIYRYRCMWNVPCPRQPNALIGSGSEKIGKRLRI